MSRGRQNKDHKYNPYCIKCGTEVSSRKETKCSNCGGTTFISDSDTPEHENLTSNPFAKLLKDKT